MPEQTNWVQRRFAREKAKYEHGPVLHSALIAHFKSVVEAFQSGNVNNPVIIILPSPDTKWSVRITNNQNAKIFDVTVDYDRQGPSSQILVNDRTKEDDPPPATSYSIEADDNLQAIYVHSRTLISIDDITKNTLEAILFPKYR